MAFDGLRLSMRPLPGTLPLWHARTEADRLAEVCRAAASQGGRLAALWGSDDRIANAPVKADSPAGFTVHLILANRDGALWLTASLP